MRGLLLLTAVLLFIGIASLPIGYYTFLRFVVTISSVAVVLTEYEGEITLTILVFGVCALLFNPLIPVYLQNKAVWTILDLGFGMLFLVKGLSFRTSKKSS